MKEENMAKIELYLSDNIDILKTFEDNSIDSVVTDPPYGISFMGKKWDYDVPSVALWQEVLRVLKPGGHALVACGTRTQHRMAVNLEDAGFEIRDIVAWVYGSGFPKSHDISKAIDKKNGVEQPKNVVISKNNSMSGANYTRNKKDIETDQAKQWKGWGTSLKPAMELWTLCRKPLKSTVAENVLQWGVGGINVDGCRVETEGEILTRPICENGSIYSQSNIKYNTGSINDIANKLGRFPANFIHDGSDEVVSLFPETNPSKATYRGLQGSPFMGIEGSLPKQGTNTIRGHDDEGGSAARFFYTAKASQSERNYGLNEIKNIHPTVKPIKLMRYLCKLITPPNGTILDPYMGSGSTGIACELENFNFIGIEQHKEYFEISKARIDAHKLKGIFKEEKKELTIGKQILTDVFP